jgi:hypothetical protein
MRMSSDVKGRIAVAGRLSLIMTLSLVFRNYGIISEKKLAMNMSL